MRSIRLIACILLLAAVCLKAAPSEIVVSCVPDHADATYRAGEPVTFTITVTETGRPMTEGTLEWSLTKDGVPPMSHGTAVLKAGVATVTGRLNEPGFLQCKIKLNTQNGSVRGLGAAAIEPLSIRASLPVPEDFDDFWHAKKQELARVPLNARLTPVPDSTAGIEFFDVRADAVGPQPVSGYYARPKGAGPKSSPAILILEGAGVYGTRPALPRQWAADGYLALEINAHGIPNGQPDEYYHALERGPLKDYAFNGRSSRETFYFLNLYLRALRGADFLAAQPEWDGRVLVSYGASQGAAQAIFVAANDPRVTFLAAMVPAMCDHSGMVAGRVPGWPRLVPVIDGQPDPAVLETSRYFDSVNFATRVRAPTFFVAGFIDMITPPTSVYAAFNSLPGEKEMHPAIHSPHKIEPEIWELVRRQVLLRR
jgi:cephalosporin-C deacetylase